MKFLYFIKTIFILYICLLLFLFKMNQENYSKTQIDNGSNFDEHIRHLYQLRFLLKQGQVSELNLDFFLLMVDISIQQMELLTDHQELIKRMKKVEKYEIPLLRMEMKKNIKTSTTNQKDIKILKTKVTKLKRDVLELDKNDNHAPPLLFHTLGHNNNNKNKNNKAMDDGLIEYDDLEKMDEVDRYVASLETLDYGNFNFSEEVDENEAHCDNNITPPSPPSSCPSSSVGNVIHDAADVSISSLPSPVESNSMVQHDPPEASSFSLPPPVESNCMVQHDTPEASTALPSPIESNSIVQHGISDVSSSLPPPFESNNMVQRGTSDASSDNNTFEDNKKQDIYNKYREHVEFKSIDENDKENIPLSTCNYGNEDYLNECDNLDYSVSIHPRKPKSSFRRNLRLKNIKQKESKRQYEKEVTQIINNFSKIKLSNNSKKLTALKLDKLLKKDQNKTKKGLSLKALKKAIKVRLLWHIKAKFKKK